VKLTLESKKPEIGTSARVGRAFYFWARAVFMDRWMDAPFSLLTKNPKSQKPKSALADCD
jgi:hypothetical protein